MDRFDAMNVFVRVVEAGSLSGAARAIPMSLTSVSRHLSALEKQFGMQLLLIDRAGNLVEEDIHLAIRVGRLPDSALVARKLGDVRMIVCAAPSYIERRGAPCSPDELRRHDCLVFTDRPGPVDRRFKSAGTRHSARITGRLWANALDVLAAAAIDGAGIVRAPSWQVADDIELGRLRRILQDYETMPAPVNVLFERARRTSPS